MCPPETDAMGLELREQLETWGQLWRRRPELEALARAVAAPGLRRILLAGCGDCHAAAEYGAALTGLRTRFEVRALPAMEASRAYSYLLGPETLLVALSISGRTPRVLEAVRAARKAGSTVLAVTDDADSPLAQAAQERLVLGTAPEEALHRTDYADPEAARYIGYQRPVAQTKTYGAAELALALLALAWEDLAPSGRGSPRASLEGALAELAASGEAAAGAGAAAAALWSVAPPGSAATFCATGLGFSAARFAAYKFLELA
ncbi:MAG: SIS domain-containing protein, partial [Deltaproteobacteria bacterium]|nr:SIS domain-containing protein [Deltaproteobacteria bacterium]